MARITTWPYAPSSIACVATSTTGPSGLLARAALATSTKMAQTRVARMARFISCPLIGERYRELAVAIGAGLAYVLTRGLHEGESDAGLRPRRGDAHLPVGAEVLAPGARAARISGALEELVVADRMRVAPEPHIPAEPRGAAKAVARRTERDVRDGKIGRQVGAVAEHGARFGIRERRPNAHAAAQAQVHLARPEARLPHIGPGTLVADHECRPVAHLRVPTPRRLLAEKAVHHVLRLTRARRGAHDAERGAQVIDRGSAARAQVAHHVRPACVGPVDGIGYREVRVGRRVDALSYRDHDPGVRAQRAKPSRRIVQVREQRELHAIRVMPVVAREEIVLERERRESRVRQRARGNPESARRDQAGDRFP